MRQIYTNVCGSQYMVGCRVAGIYSLVHIYTMNDIATQLDEAMRAKGVDQPWLEKASGVSQATISRTLKGKTTPETQTLRKLFATLNLSTQLIEFPDQAAIPLQSAKDQRSRQLVKELCDLAEQIDDDGLRGLIDVAACFMKTHLPEISIRVLTSVFVRVYSGLGKQVVAAEQAGRHQQELSGSKGTSTATRPEAAPNHLMGFGVKQREESWQTYSP